VGSDSWAAERIASVTGAMAPAVSYAVSSDGVTSLAPRAGDGPLDVLYVPTWIFAVRAPCGRHPRWRILRTNLLVLAFDHVRPPLAPTLRPDSAEGSRSRNQMDDVRRSWTPPALKRAALFAQMGAVRWRCCSRPPPDPHSGSSSTRRFAPARCTTGRAVVRTAEHAMPASTPSSRKLGRRSPLGAGSHEPRRRQELSGLVRPARTPVGSPAPSAG